MKFDEKGNIIWPERKKVSVLKEGNIAFKCTYNDNGYWGVCSDRIYRYNINAGRVWCNDPHNDCREFVDKDISESDYPCYESALFLNWSFGAGVRRGEKYYGIPFKIKKAFPDKLAFLTTRDPFQTEEERYIFGFLHIKRIANIHDPTGPRAEIAVSQFVVGDPEKSLKFDPIVKLRFWRYYKNETNPNNIQWGTGLFRYLNDKTVLEILIDAKKEYEKTKNERVLNMIDFQISRYEK